MKIVGWMNIVAINVLRLVFFNFFVNLRLEILIELVTIDVNL